MKMKQEKLDYYEDRVGFRGKKRFLNGNEHKNHTSPKKVCSNRLDFGKTNFLVHRIGDKKIVVKPRCSSTPDENPKPFQAFKNQRANNYNAYHQNRRKYPQKVDSINNKANNLILDKTRNLNAGNNNINGRLINPKTPISQVASNRISQNLDLNNNPTSSNGINGICEISPTAELNNSILGKNIIVTQEFLVDFAQNFAQEFSQRFFSHFSAELSNLNSILLAQMRQNANQFQND